MATKDQQVKHVVEGVALGVLAQGVEAVTSAKGSFELNFNGAWRRWSRADQFPSLNDRPGEQFWIGVGKSQGRRGATAAWDRHQWAAPFLLGGYRDWSVDECLDLHADERASPAQWKELGQLYVAQFRPEEIRYFPA